MATALSEDKNKEFTEAFHAMDKGGRLGPFELGILMRSLNHNPTDDDLNKIIDEYDVYAKGGINLQEFLEIMSKREIELELRERLLFAFSTFSRDDNGFISVDDLKQKMMTIGTAPYVEKEFEEFVAEAAIDSDGQLDYSAFIDVMLKKR
eukprot:GEMP01072785.1.p1 GENE.GEMP01072785.1~~GEMP01072785.1.p1  ORF type:complete len:150 (+),score=29.13 GEMP01072785.1:57-506(+)